jgi:orotidine-5'-phosphate decarboxylase
LKRIIVALDGVTIERAVELAQALRDTVWGYKLNDLLIEGGVAAISKLRPYGRVFADAKLYDIPNTVKNGVRRLSEAGADLITIHASGGAAMIAAARDAAGSSKILAVTILTSMNDQTALSIYQDNAASAVTRLARIAATAGAHGLVLSPNELQLVSALPEAKELLLVTPGIRPANANAESRGDQSRIATAADAIQNGASLLVVGRPITESDDPLAAAEALNREISQL